MEYKYLKNEDLNLNKSNNQINNSQYETSFPSSNKCSELNEITISNIKLDYNNRKIKDTNKFKRKINLENEIENKKLKIDDNHHPKIIEIKKNTLSSKLKTKKEINTNLLKDKSKIILNNKNNESLLNDLKNKNCDYNNKIAIRRKEFKPSVNYLNKIDNKNHNEISRKEIFKPSINYFKEINNKNQRLNSKSIVLDANKLKPSVPKNSNSNETTISAKLKNKMNVANEIKTKNSESNETIITSNFKNKINVANNKIKKKNNDFPSKKLKKIESFKKKTEGLNEALLNKSTQINEHIQSKDIHNKKKILIAEKLKKKNKISKGKFKKLKLNIMRDNVSGEEFSEEDDISDWEEVKDLPEVNKRSCLNAVEVVIENNKGQKKTKKLSMEERVKEELRCYINRSRNLTCQLAHKVHLLCLLACGCYRNDEICNNDKVKAYALSLIPMKFFGKSVEKWDMGDLKMYIRWFRDFYKVNNVDSRKYGSLSNKTKKQEILSQFKFKTFSREEHIMLFVASLRSLGFMSRLIHSFHPINFKPINLIKKDQIINDSNNKVSTINNGVRSSDWWSEVYLKSEKKWIYASSLREHIGGLKDIQKYCNKPFSYIISHDNDGSIKDLTSKYDDDWLKKTLTKRLDPDWWNLVCLPFKKNQSTSEYLEDLNIQDNLTRKPLPKSLSEYKKHPLYVIKKHLLKYEAIYPPSTQFLGFIRGEAVYPRDCIHQLHSKEKWLLEGRKIKDNEEAYKIVMSRPKMKSKSFEGTNNSIRPLHLFGRWQTEKYIPPIAENGIVPKNSYGNVELFQPWMLPPGTVFLEEQMIGLAKIAKNLGLDIAPAMLGWDFHNKISHPILRGWVVCEENRDVLVSAWQEEQKMIRQKERQKNEQKILNNWKLLTKGLLIKQRLLKRFQLEVTNEVL